MQDNQADPLDIALGERIRTRRRQMGLSQGALGERLGITFQQIQKYERGTNRVSFSALVRISQTLGCRVTELVGDLDDPAAIPSPVSEIKGRLGSGEVQDLLDVFARIPSRAVRKNVMQLAQALAKSEAADAA